jgi:DNA-binding transcriptional ArsR family regulator
MPVRIHLTDDDLANIRLAQAPDPMWEALLGMHMLQTTTGSAVFGAWRRAVRRQLSLDMGQLLRLAPPLGYSADFLTPAAGADGLDAGIDAVLSTPRWRLRGDLAELSRAGRPLPLRARQLADGDKETVTHLAGTLRRYFATALAPWWPRIRSRFDAERSVHGRYLVDGGLGSLLGTLHPGLLWHRPVLEVTGLGADRDVHLDGRGLLVLPSYFCWRKPTLLKDPELPCVVVYPMTHETALGDREPEARSLNALLGRTRAVILESLAARGVTTTELAHGTGVSLATASHHVGVLRKAGLVSSCKVHTVTPLGRELLDGRTGQDLTFRHVTRRLPTPPATPRADAPPGPWSHGRG